MSLALPAGQPAVAADDPVPVHEGMPDDGFANEPESEQDDTVAPDGASATGSSVAPAAPVPGRPADFRLAAGSDLGSLVGRLDAALPKQGLTELLAQANRPAGRGAADCGDTGIYGPDLTADRTCWKSDDATSTEWIPQAISGVSDAQEDEDWGTSNAEPVAVGSYDNKNPGRSDYVAGRDNCLKSGVSDACNEKGVRVTFFNQATKKYRHVLLVWPYVNSADHISFDALHAREGLCNQVVTEKCGAQNGIHAGGMVWYGNYLYVADTANGMRVFDLRKIMDLNPDNDSATEDKMQDGLPSDLTDKKRIGRQSNVWYAYGYRYVMPQVATLKFTTAKPSGDSSKNQCYKTGRPKASYVSLDRTGTDHLILGEYCNMGKNPTDTMSNGRVGTYPMTALTAAVEGASGKVADADQAYGLPTGATFGDEPLWHKIQGALRYEGHWYFHRSNAYDNGRLLQATAGGDGQLAGNAKTLQTSFGPEDLYLAHGRGDGRAPRLWSLSEHAPSACGACEREVYSYPMNDVVSGFGS
ncbi:hypothetical protein [Streptomyces sp. SID5910]|uniref:hypothetical protein n=1 Tax=Streptomyces sp. SID5910 TaxID=2690312 RepID=UPI001367C60A|nr:hypothetical protein [Streptomyces sp. SID5910]MYR42724.1 hypothetical protein [Streptomyces sp. SID5910]